MNQQPNIRVLEEKYEDTVIFNTDTGEIIKTIKDKTPKKKLSPLDKYIGVDVRYPKDCLTKDQLVETLSVLDAYVKGASRVNTHYLVESMAAGYITPQQQTFLFHLAKNLTGWNIFIGTREDLCSWGVDSKSLKRVLASLEGSYICVVSENIPYKGCVRVHINPLIGWKGDLQMREQKKMDWYSVSGIDVVTELTASQ